MNEKRDNHFKLKQNFLRQLLLNSSHKKVMDINTQLKEFEISIDPYSDYRIILLSIDRFELFSNQYHFEDRELLKYGFMNITSELLAQVGHCECIGIDDRHVAVLLNGDFETDVHLTEVVKQVQDAIHHYLNFSISISISSVGDNLYEISDLYKEALVLLENKYMAGYGSILQGNHHLPQVIAPFTHPTGLENNMLETLKLGKAEETKKWLNELINSIEHPSYMVYNMLFNQLAYSISTTAINHDKSSGVALDYDFSSFIQQLHKKETLQDAHAHFCELIDQLCLGFKDRKVSKHDNLIASIDKIIQLNYGDRELSLFKIAELIDMSPAYLGRIFKKLTTQSIPDYLNEYRIVQAKELLAKTHDSIEEISQKTGYNNSTYFYKVFKKYTGITPAEYRNHGS
ncbi:HTH-type transcriptional regulator YesS [compost metagenome]